MLLLIKFGLSLKWAVYDWFPQYDISCLYSLAVGCIRMLTASFNTFLRQAIIHCSSNWLLISDMNSSTGKLYSTYELSFKFINVFICLSLITFICFSTLPAGFMPRVGYKLGLIAGWVEQEPSDESFWVLLASVDADMPRWSSS